MHNTQKISDQTWKSYIETFNRAYKQMRKHQEMTNIIEIM